MEGWRGAWKEGEGREGGEREGGGDAGGMADGRQSGCPEEGRTLVAETQRCLWDTLPCSPLGSRHAGAGTCAIPAGRVPRPAPASSPLREHWPLCSLWSLLTCRQNALSQRSHTWGRGAVKGRQGCPCPVREPEEPPPRGPPGSPLLAAQPGLPNLAPVTQPEPEQEETRGWGSRGDSTLKKENWE